MRIGLFTDSYHPSTNGITVVVDIMKKNLEALGHEVFIVAPAPSLKWWHMPEKNVIRFASIRGLFFHESYINIFFPPRQYRKINRLRLDVVILLTPAQIGMMGAYVAIKDNIPLVSQYSTDLLEYVERYPATMPAVMALSTALPLVFKPSTKDLLRLTNASIPKNRSAYNWRQTYGKELLAFIHNQFDAVIAVSPKVAKMIKEWGVSTPIHTIPTGVDSGLVDKKRVLRIKKKYGLQNKKVLLSLGRVAKEKNIDLIIDALPFVLEYHPDTVLLIVGDFNHRAVLEHRVQEMALSGNVIFTGKVAFKDRWNYFALADVFCFPSLTDTQALVVNEAALMGLPIVWCDEGVNEVLRHKKSGLKTEDKPSSYAKGLIDMLSDNVSRKTYGAWAKKQAQKMSEQAQTKKLVRVIERLLKTKR